MNHFAVWPYQEYPTTWKLEKRRKKLSPIAVRSTSCFCSSCRDQKFSECLIQPGFPDFISECQVRNVTEVVTRTCSSTENLTKLTGKRPTQHLEGSTKGGTKTSGLVGKLFYKIDSLQFV